MLSWHLSPRHWIYRWGLRLGEKSTEKGRAQLKMEDLPRDGNERV
jgi:hypothetical protein